MLPSAFTRLRGLLRDIDPPPGREPVPLHLGEFRGDTPEGPFDGLADVDAWCRYPPLGGTGELRSAYLDWLDRRFDLGPSSRDGTIAAEPTPGSKQAVAAAIALATARARADGDADGDVDAPVTPRIVLPNPFYPTYLAATEAVGARAVFYPTAMAVAARPGGDLASGDVGSGDLGSGDLGSGGLGSGDVGVGAVEAGVAAGIAAAVRRAGGRVAAIVVCSPGNPRGEILSAPTLREIWTTAAAAGATLIVDECYTDLSTAAPPPGFLTVVAAAEGASGDRAPAGRAPAGRAPADRAPAGRVSAPYLVLHSLSKRSGSPGLRSGFVAGDAATVGAYATYNRSCGVSSPLPVCAAAAALWSDDGHVARRRAALARTWDLADEILGDLRGYRRAEAGFFLWLPVRDDEDLARRLWRADALSVMPGRYLAVEDATGVNPGANHLRIALVHQEKVMEEALGRIRATVAR
jgi:aspartate/methionine/tyrosine aminotransferase